MNLLSATETNITIATTINGSVIDLTIKAPTPTAGLLTLNEMFDAFDTDNLTALEKLTIANTPPRDRRSVRREIMSFARDARTAAAVETARVASSERTVSDAGRRHTVETIAQDAE